jgi:hypothetical protein
MTDYKLKVKIGEHEFEAEGPVDVVKAQFETFKQLINPSTTPVTDALVAEPPFTLKNSDSLFSMKDHRIVTFNDPTKSGKDAILYILYGRKMFQINDPATGGEIKRGLVASGYSGAEISRRLRELCVEKLTVPSGSHRAKRYQLTPEGLSKIQAELRETVIRRSQPYQVLPVFAAGRRAIKLQD